MSTQDKDSLWLLLTITAVIIIGGLGLWKLYELIDREVGWIELSIYIIIGLFGLILFKIILSFIKDIKNK